MSSSLSQRASILSSSQLSDSSLLGGNITSSKDISEKVVEEVLMDRKYLDVKNEGVLLGRVKDTAKVLQRIDQARNPPWAEKNPNLPKTLINKKLLLSQNPEMSIYVCSAVVDVLRIVAPDHPYTDTELQLIFTALFDQFRLFTSVGGELLTFLYQLLEKITSVKLFRVIADSMPELTAKYVDTIYEVVGDKKEFHRQVERLFAENLILLFEENEEIDSDVLQCVLDPLARFSKVKESKTKEGDAGAAKKSDESDNDEEDTEAQRYPYQSAFDLSAAVLNGAAEHILTPLSSFINSELAAVKKTKKATKKSKNRRAKLFHILLQLNNINTKLLLYIMPNICEQLRDENIAIRLPAVQLLGKMFSSKESYLHRDYQQIFEGEFLSRFADIDTNIRFYMCRFAGLMIRNHISTRDVINARLTERLRDLDEKVRKEIIDTVCRVAKDDDTLISVPLMKEVAARCRDKKIQLRLHAMHEVAKLYRYAKELELTTAKPWTDEQMEKYNWIPVNIMQYSITMEDAGHRMFTEMLLYDDMLPDREDLRTQTIFDIYLALSEMDRKVFEKIVERKSAFRAGLRAFFDETDSKRKQLFIAQLSDQLPDKKTGKSFWKKYDSADQRVKDIINRTLNDVGAWDQVRKIKVRLDKLKSQISEDEHTYLDYIIKRTSMNLLTQQQLSVLFEVILAEFEEEEANRDMGRVYNCLNMVLFFAEKFPELVNTECIRFLNTFMEKGDERINVASLKILKQSSVKATKTNKDLEKQLLQFVRRGTAAEAKYASQCIASLFDNAETLFDKIFSDETRSLSATMEKLPCILSTLAFIAKKYPAIYKEKSLRILDFAIDEVLMTNQGDDPTTFYAKPSYEVECKRAAMQLLVSHLHFLYSGHSDTYSAETDSKRIINTLVELVRAKGDSVRAASTISSQGSDVMEDEDKVTLDKISQVHIRLAAGTALLKIACIPRFHAQVSRVQNLTMLADFARDENMHARQDFATCLMRYLSQNRLSNKFYALLLLFVGDEEPHIAQMARKYVTLVFKALKTVLVRTGPYNLDAKEAPLIYPEYILPTLVLLLARWPNFDDLYPQFLLFQKILFAYFDEVTQDFDNYSFFLQLIRRIKQRRDVDYPRANNSLVICDMAMSVLNNCAENRNFSTLPFPGKILIPPFFVDASISSAPEDKDLEFRTVYLPQDFKLAIRGARSFTPKKKALGRSPAKSPAKKRTRKATGTATKRKRKSTKKDADTTPEPSQKRRRIARSAKSAKKVYTEMQDEELDTLLERENDESSEEEESGAATSAEEDNMEEKSPPARSTRRKRRAL